MGEKIMKKAFIGVVFLAAAYTAFAGGSMWAESDRVVYDGESELFFSYTGPEGVSARVYEDGTFLGSLSAGETKRRITGDGGHTIEVRSGVYNAATEQTVEGPQSLNLRITARKNRSRIRIAIARTNGQNRVTDLALTDTAAIQTRPKPQQAEASGQTPPAGQAVAQSRQSGADNTQSMQQLADTAQRHLEKGEYDQVIAAYSEILRRDPGIAAAYSNRGFAWYQKGDIDKAIADYTQAIRLDPGYAAAYLNRGFAYLKKGELDKAIADYTETIRLSPNEHGAYAMRGTAYVNKGEPDKAIADLDRAIRLEPADIMSYASRGTAYFMKQDYNRSIADHTAAIRMDPNYIEAYMIRGNAYMFTGEYARAVADIEKALQLNPNAPNMREARAMLRQMGY
jgi:tetratricopeptide (TPR) repeat protein